MNTSRAGYDRKYGGLKTLAALALLLLNCASAPADDALQRRSFESSGASRTFHLYVPASPVAAPLLIVLHGSGSSGRAAVEPWVDLARREGVIVVGPSAARRQAWSLRTDGPSFVRGVVDAVEELHAIDRRRIYLFGHSGGAVYALTLAMIESQCYAAAAVYAGAWRTEREFNALAYAQRKIPVAIFIGDRDPFFSLSAARRTESALAEAGHPVLLTVLPGQRHDYPPIAAQVNAAAWDFVRHVQLSGADAANVCPAEVIR